MRSRLVALAVAVGTFVPHLARADAASDGERLFEEGRGLMLAGKFEAACAKLEESQAIDPHVGTLLNLATCHEKIGKVGSAWVEYQKALTSARVEGRNDRAELAKARIAAIEGRVPWLTVDRGAFDGTVTLDGAPLERAALGTAMPVDPGDHAISAVRDGTVVFETRVVLSEGERTTVHVSAEASKVPPKEAVIVEPNKTPVPRLPLPPRPTKPAKGNWVLELGMFGGFLAGGGSRGRLVDEGSVQLQPGVSGLEPETCASATCSVGPIDAGSSFMLGLSVLGGYAPSDAITLGLRVVAAPAVGSRGMWAIGPTIQLHPTDFLSVGVWPIFGDGSQEGDALVTTSSDYRVVGSTTASARGTLAGAVGAGLDVSTKAFDLGRASIWLTVMPFFLAGESGNMIGFPVGVAVRFQ